jgi:molecular chaperone HtpG
VLKEGIGEDFANKERLAKLFRFASTHDESGAQSVSLADYVSRMKEGQEAIYVIAADSQVAAKSSPQLELFKKKGIEVLLLTDRVDEWLLSHLYDFEGKPLQNVTKGAVDLGSLQDEEEKKKAEEPPPRPSSRRWSASRPLWASARRKCASPPAWWTHPPASSPSRAT